MNSLLLCILISALANLGVVKMPAEGRVNRLPPTPPSDSPNETGPDDRSGSDDSLGEPISEEELSDSDNLVEDPLDPDQNPIELAGLYEGDISFGKSRNAIKENLGNRKKWANAIIPYVISSAFSSNERLVIAKAIKEYQEKTCIRIQPRTSESDYVFIKKLNGCYSQVGRVGGGQTLSLGNGCINTGIVIHEFMHAAGFWHEQSRSDRDNHVTINFGNIIDNRENNFAKYTLSTISLLNAPYDFCSIMHYSQYAFSKNGQPTITKKKDSPCILGQLKGFSDVDIRKLNTLYQCTGYPQTTFTQDCEDKNEWCEGWAILGECKKNPNYMLNYCKPACDVCKADPCANKKADCQDRASRGECESNPSYMSENCRLSCDTCTADDCVNENRDCEFWASIGECDKNPGYMKVKCKRACGVCQVPECVDRRRDCESLASQGFCARAPGFMSTTCEKACGACEVEECVNNNSNCDYWASIGECKKNPNYMLFQCKKACNTCGGVTSG